MIEHTPSAEILGSQDGTSVEARERVDEATTVGQRPDILSGAVGVGAGIAFLGGAAVLAVCEMVARIAPDLSQFTR